jgi:putative hydrolase of the HAD superfamily
VPYEITWEHEHVEGDLREEVVTVARLSDLLDSETAKNEDRA